MIRITFYTEDDSYESLSLPPSEIESFVSLIKKYGVWIEGVHYKLEECCYLPEINNFEITVK